MKQRSIAVMAVLALFAALIGFGSSQVFAKDGADDRRMGPPPTAAMNGNRPDMPKLAPVNDDENQVGDEKSGQPSFGIKPSGEVIIQKGKVTASTNSSVSLSVFGFPVSVVIGTSTAQNGTSTVFAVGDTLNIRGMIDPATGIITARMIRNNAADNQAAEGIRSQIQKLMDQLKKLRIPNLNK